MTTFEFCHFKIRIKTDSEINMTAVKRIFSGIQPSGVPHIGNYFGALKNWISLQNEAETEHVIFSIVDMHSLTIPKDPDVSKENIKKTALSLLALGLDPEKCILFQQSRVLEHTQLCWVLSCLASTGELGRMHQWKTKAKQQKEKSSLGLLSYPVLMAADVLLYKSTHIPVGDDQLQHLELARDLARLFNNRYGHIFPEPQPILATSCRIMNLQSPTEKMSKSAATNRGRIDLTDSPEEIHMKIKKTVTDSIPYISYEPKERHGVANLINMYSAIKGCSPQEIVRKYEKEDQFTKYLKNDLAEELITDLERFRKEFDRLSKEMGYVTSILETGYRKASSIAGKNITEIKELLGVSF